ncbi:hypothetical protein ACFQ22_08195 [Lentilactobacillus raoultii]|uniref:MFS transporter n=1 Tax=Lentilactobacillus raoultii TaxID=1987503 RepID=A0ABW3PK20_9LACO|nr:hypothetical protein [Lentilactobacillus raoultii]
MGHVYQKRNIPILFNRLISLTAQYGYTVALNIILAKVSVNAVLFLWCTKVLGSLLSLPANHQASRLQNKKWLLIGLELAKAVIFIALPLLIHQMTLFLGVLLIEMMSDVFNGNLMALIPKVVDRPNLTQFNAAITSVGSVAYFLGPLLVGLLQKQPATFLFDSYGGITVIGALTLLRLPAIRFEDQASRPCQFSLMKHFFKMIRRLLSVDGLLAFLVIYLLLDNMGTGMDSFEVLFVTKVVGITSAQYAFSLSFLAVAFLLTSTILATVRLRVKNITGFQVGGVIYITYAIGLVASRNFWMVLFSYALLALGAVLMGTMLDNLIQIGLNDRDRLQLLMLEGVFSNILAAVTVFSLGLFQNIGFGIKPVYIGLVSVTIIGYVGIEIVRIFNRNQSKESSKN